MRYDYSKSVAIASRLLDKFGGIAIAENHKKGVDFDPTNPQSMETVKTEGYAVKTAISKYYSERYKSLIKSGDVMLICSASLDTSEGATITVGSQKFSVEKSLPLEPADTLVMSKSIARPIK